MNIYLLKEDGESFCIKAKTMQKAIKISEKIYLEDLVKNGENDRPMEEEKEYYHEQILQSCSFVEKLKN